MLWVSGAKRSSGDIIDRGISLTSMSRVRSLYVLPSMLELGESSCGVGERSSGDDHRRISLTSMVDMLV